VHVTVMAYAANSSMDALDDVFGNQVISRGLWPL
jgi:hypothetical protein